MTPPLILDGGMSRELIRLSAPFAQPEWSALALLQAPHFVKQAHADFLSAGADVLTTNSYALVPFHIGAARFWERGRELAALSGRLAREAADEEMARTGRKVLVGGCLPPMFGSYEPQRFKGEEVGEYLEVLVEGLAPYVDFWLAETLSLIAEGEAVLDATRGTGKAVWIGFTPDDGEHGSPKVDEVRLRSGEKVAEVAQWASKQVSKGEMEALLFNCCRPEFMDGALAAAVQVLGEDSGMKLGVYANSFVPRSNEYAANEDVSPTDREITPAAYTKDAARWREMGAEIVGGCCGIGHWHIEAVAKALKD